MLRNQIHDILVSLMIKHRRSTMTIKPKGTNIFFQMQKTKQHKCIFTLVQMLCVFHVVFIAYVLNEQACGCLSI